MQIPGKYADWQQGVKASHKYERTKPKWAWLCRLLPYCFLLSEENRVFVLVYGKMVDNCTINRAINSALSRLEEQGKQMEHFTAHALRDTFATRYIEQGGSPQTLKTILGHSSLAMTMDLYSHVLPNTKQKEMDNLKIVL